MTVTTLPQNTTDSTGELGTNNSGTIEAITIISATLFLVLVFGILRVYWRFRVRQALERAISNPADGVRILRQFEGCC